LILIAKKSAEDLKRLYGLAGPFPIAYIGLDKEIFNPDLRQRMRPEVRKKLNLDDDKFVLVLVGNNWKKKGFVTLIVALAQLKDLPLVLVVAGKDDPVPYQSRLRRWGLQEKVKFCPSRADVQWYSAAADVYIGPSLEDTFAHTTFTRPFCNVHINTMQKQKSGKGFPTFSENFRLDLFDRVRDEHTYLAVIFSPAAQIHRPNGMRRIDQIPPRKRITQSRKSGICFARVPRRR